ncbi:MAG: MotA/TolQ/ExbB proton channel family protein [Akkermansiaceae bacterium]
MNLSLRIFLLLALALAGAAQGAEKTTDQAKNIQELNFMELFVQGGPVMYPLAGLSIIAATLCLLYLFTIRQNSVVSDRFMDEAESMIRSRDLQGLTNFSRRQSECMARITQRVLDFIIANPSVTLAEVREITESEGSRQAGILSSRVSYLSDIGNVAPMLGLLGTVIGMIQAFFDLSQGNEGVKQMQLSSGISTALITTAAGLIIAIPTMLAYAFFRTRTQRYIGELEAASSHLVALLQTLTVKSPQTANSSGRNKEYQVSGGQEG